MWDRDQKRLPVRLTWVKNVLVPTESMQRYVFPYMGNGSILDYIPPDVVIDEHTIIRQNGHIIARERWSRRHVSPGDELHVVSVPGDPVTMSVVTTALITSAVSLTVSVGVSYLATLFAEKPEPAEPFESGTYGAGEIRTIARNGAPIPIVYGEHVVGGNIIRATSAHTYGHEPGGTGGISRTIGGARTQALVALCEGPIQSIAGATSDFSSLQFGTDGQFRILYGNLGATPTGALAFRDGTNDKVAFPFRRRSTDDVVSHVWVTLRKKGVIATSANVEMAIHGDTTNGNWYDRPASSPLTAASKVQASSIPAGWKRVTFKLPEPVRFGHSSWSWFWVVLSGDWTASTSNTLEIATIPTLWTGSKIVSGDFGSWTLQSYGPIAEVASYPERYSLSAGGIKINGLDIASYSASGSVSGRLGALEQDPIPGTSDISIETSVGTRLQRDRDYEASTQNEVDGVGVVFQFPQGYWHVDAGGKRDPADFWVHIWLRVTGTVGWSEHYYVDERIRFLHPDIYTVRLDFPIDKNKPFSQLRGQKLDLKVRVDSKSFRSDNPVDWKSIREYSDEQAQTYPHLAIVGIDTELRTAAGPLDKITTLVEGKRVWQYASGAWSYGYSTNPAWCTLDYLLNERYGLGTIYSQSNVDLDLFETWADYCDELIDDGDGGLMKRWETGIVIDREKASWEWAQRIAATGRCKLIRSGSIIRPRIDKAVSSSEITQTFSDGNVVVGSFRTQWLGKSKRPNVLEVKFLNQDLDYAEDIATARAAGLRADGEEDIKESVELYGVTKRARALRAAQYLLNLILYTDWVAEFETFIDALGCEPGDVVAINSEALRSDGIGGRLKENAPAGGNAIILDKDLVIDGSGDAYKITVRTTVSGQDAILTATIDELAGTYAAGTTVDITPSWTTLPSAGDVYSVIPIRSLPDSTNAVGAKLARVIKTEITGDHFVRLRVAQYDSRIYEDSPDDVTAPPVPQVIDGRVIPPRPRNMAIKVEYHDSSRHNRVLVTWAKSPWPIPYECILWARLEDGDINGRYHRVGSTSGSAMAFNDIVEGRIYRLAVTPAAPDTGQHHNPDSAFAIRRRIFVQRPDSQMRKERVTSLTF